MKNKIQNIRIKLDGISQLVKQLVSDSNRDKVLDSILLAKGWLGEIAIDTNHTKYIVTESEGFGTMESPIKVVFRKDFRNPIEADKFLYEYRKDEGKSWANWETPFTYEIHKQEPEYLEDFILDPTSSLLLPYLEDFTYQQKVLHIIQEIRIILLEMRYTPELELSNTNYSNTLVSNLTTNLTQAIFFLKLELLRVDNMELDENS